MSVADQVTNPPVRRVAWLPNLLLAVASVIFAIALGEGALRISGQFTPNTYPPQSSRPGLFEAYEPYGYRLIPSRHTTYSYPLKNARTLSLNSNRDGFRANRELDEPDSRRRVLFLGDSFVFGDGVEESERFTNVLESLEPSWRIDNLGMVGYGPDLMVRALEAVGLKLKPSLVVFCMYTDDFRRVRPEYAGTGFLIPRYKLESGALVSVPYPAPNLWNRLSLSVALDRVLWHYTNWQWDLNRAILDRFEQLAEKQGFKQAIVFLPGRDDTAGDRERRAWLRDYAARHGAPFLDISDPIHAMGSEPFIPENPHFNPKGHQATAQELDRFLRGSILASN